MAEAMSPMVFSAQPENEAATSLKLVSPGMPGALPGAEGTPGSDIVEPRVHVGQYVQPSNTVG